MKDTIKIVFGIGVNSEDFIDDSLEAELRKALDDKYRLTNSGFDFIKKERTLTFLEK